MTAAVLSGRVHEAVAGRQLPPAPDRLPSPVVDNHTHLDACGCATADDVAVVVERAAAAGVAAMITVADDLESAHWAAQAAAGNEHVYAAIAVHPTFASQLDDRAKAGLEELAIHQKVVAIGETGLDFYWDAAPHDIQRDAFAWHIDLAKRVGKPLMIHDRNAHQAIFDVLQTEGAPAEVVFHCFSGDAPMARKCADLGFFMSFAGPVSFKNAADLADAARVAPAELILLETDAPFLTPHPHRGRRNEPFALAYTARAIAELRRQPLVELCDQVRANTEGVYGIRVNSSS